MVYIKKKARRLFLKTLFLLGILILSGPRTLIDIISGKGVEKDNLSNAADSLFGVDVAHGDTPAIVADGGLWVKDGPQASACGTGNNASAGTMSDGNETYGGAVTDSAPSRSGPEAT